MKLNTTLLPIQSPGFFLPRGNIQVAVSRRTYERALVCHVYEFQIIVISAILLATLACKHAEMTVGVPRSIRWLPALAPVNV